MEKKWERRQKKERKKKQEVRQGITVYLPLARD